MEHQYGTDLFDRLRPDWQSVESGMIESLCNDEDKRVLVAAGQHSVEGFIVATPDTATGLASIDVVAVRPSEQHAGIGSSLVERSLDDLRQMGMAYVQAYLRDFPGHEPARGLLTRAGFFRMPMQPMPLYMPLTDSLLEGVRPKSIRPIADTDVDQCVRFGLESFRSVYASFEERHGEDVFPRMFPEWENVQAEYMEAACTSGDKETWVYESDGAASGFVVLTTDPQKLGDIELLAVDPDAQGAGIGTMLNRFGISRLRELGMEYAIVATADDPGHAAARRSYEKVGFIPMPIQWNFLIAKL
jgi:ribosomal protein S18 acetylase RimI-like enzyme